MVTQSASHCHSLSSHARSLNYLQIMQAGARGLPCTVFRTAFISGHSRTGMCNEKDMMCRLLRSMAELGTAPTVAGWPSSSEAQSTRASITEHVMDMTPVDWAARACVYASRTYNWLRSHKGEGVGARVLSLRSPNHAVTVHMLFEAVVASGYTCRPLAYETWKDQVTQTSSTPFAPLIARFPRTGDMPAHRSFHPSLRAKLLPHGLLTHLSIHLLTVLLTVSSEWTSRSCRWRSRVAPGCLQWKYRTSPCCAASTFSSTQASCSPPPAPLGSPLLSSMRPPDSRAVAFGFFAVVQCNKTKFLSKGSQAHRLCPR